MIEYVSGKLTLDWGVISVSGTDAVDYLNRQCTSDIVSLLPNTFQHSALLEISGKLQSYFIVCKVTSTELILLVQKNLVDATLKRLAQYLFAEDCHIKLTDSITTLLLGPEAEGVAGFHGNFLNEKCAFGIDTAYEGVADLSEENFQLKRLFAGYPLWDCEVGNELITNSFLSELCINTKKGCFLGQETVAKIMSRRGAAFYPALLKSDGKIKGKLVIDDKKIGEAITSFISDGTIYIYATLNRQSRVEGKKLEVKSDDGDAKVEVHHFPYFKSSYQERSVKLYDSAIDYYHKGQLEMSRELLELSMKYDPENKDAFEIYGVLLGREGKFHEAISFMEKLLEIDPKSVMAHTNLSFFYMQLGDKETAEEHKSLATVKTFEALGDEAASKRKQEEERELKQQELKRREVMFHKVLELDHEDAVANYGLADISFDRGNYVEAETFLLTALKGDSHYSVAYLLLGKVLFKLGKIEEAKKYLTSGIDIAASQGEMMPANQMQALLNQNFSS